MMRRSLSAWLTLVLLLAGLCMPAHAAGTVTFRGDAEAFVFEPGSDQSPTDLFSDFKQVMPGDTLTQSVTLYNPVEKVDVKIFLRALGVHGAEGDGEFLSQLTLSVKAGESTLFHAPAHQTAQLTDWVPLGVLAPDGRVELQVTLQVPTTLDNRFMDRVGLLDWQFLAEVYPIISPDQPPIDPDSPPVDPDKPPVGPGQPDDPDVPPVDPDVPPVDPDVPPVDPDVPPVDPDQPSKPDVPKTGDLVPVGLFISLFAGSGLLILILLFILVKKRKQNNERS